MGKLHPKVSDFKEFVSRHPGIVKEVRSNRKSWQDFFEDWYMFGEEDDMWKKYRTGSNKEEVPISNRDHSNKDADFMAQFLSLIKNIDINEMQKHIHNISGAIANVQQIVDQFQSFKQNNRTPNMRRPGNQNHPFFYPKD